jgi:6-phosphofructokinase 1
LEGLIQASFIELNEESVAHIIHTGGTILHTSRSPAFRQLEGMKTAAHNLKEKQIDALIVIGGDGTFSAMHEFNQHFPMPIIGIPGTIDKDLSGTDVTLGFDTAVNTAMYAIDKIRDTAESHDRVFFVEVMGRDAGYIALDAGIATGAEAILIPETTTYIDQLIALLETGWKRKKRCHIIIVAEGDDAGGAIKIAEQVQLKFKAIDTRVSILGHIQRGGSPTVRDRILGSRWGFAAVDLLLQGKKGIALGITNNNISETPFHLAVKEKPVLSKEMMNLLYVLSS